VLRRMMVALVARLREQVNVPFAARVFVDTAPILEKELAVAAGLGWIGKNTCLLNAELGSYLLLGEIVTTLDLAFGSALPSRCASCTRCLDACPSRALIGPHRINASRCISYLTIEHRGAISPEAQPAIGDRLVGCDVCQQVCPYNARVPPGINPEIAADVLPARLKLLPAASLREDEYRQMVRRSAARRLTRHVLRRNAEIVLANVGRRQAQGLAARS
jgi:epoxyqueuosine reductase